MSDQKEVALPELDVTAQDREGNEYVTPSRERGE